MLYELLCLVNKTDKKYSSYENEIKTLINSLATEDRPQLHGNVDKEEWLSQKFTQPVAISLSTFFGEDFGVSLAQAGEKGWPVICSHFGGHRDICGNQVAQIPSWLVGSSHETNGVVKLKSVLAARYFFNHRFSKIPLPQEDADIPKPAIIALNELDKARRDLSHSLGSSIHLLSLDTIDNFADTQEGAQFIDDCLKFLEGSKPEVLIILSEKSQENLISEDREFLKSAMESLLPTQHFQILNSHEMTFKNNLRKLKEAQKVVASDGVDEKLKKTISQLFP